jgi:hypothetical protein
MSVALIGVLSGVSLLHAADFPVTTSSAQPKNGTSFLGRNGILFPWLNGHGYGSSKDAGNRNMFSSGMHGYGTSSRSGMANAASPSGRHGYGFTDTAPLERRANRESTGVLPNLSHLTGNMFKK